MALTFALGNYVSVPGWGASNSGSWSFWMRTTQTSANITLFSRCEVTGSFNGFTCRISGASSSITVEIKSGTSLSSITGSTVVNDGNWHHVAYSFVQGGGGAQQLWIDGVSQGTGTAISWAFVTSREVRLGKDVGSFWTGYVGELAEVAWWDNVFFTAGDIVGLSRAFAPHRVRPAGLRFYLPLVRDARDLRGSTQTVSGTSASDHCRRYG